MKKQLIEEAKRMQLLAGIITESEMHEDNMYEDNMDEVEIDEMEMDEMARTAGTGGSYTITPEGEDVLRKTKASGEVPAGLKGSQLAILIFLFKAKKEDKRVQKIDYANEKGVAQPAVNALFNDLEVKNLVTKGSYTTKQKEPGSTKPKTDFKQDLDSLELD